MDNDLGVIAKSGADGVILVGNKMPIEAALVSSRNYRKQMVILAETNELSHETSVKLLALGASGIFLKNKCTGRVHKKYTHPRGAPQNRSPMGAPGREACTFSILFWVYFFVLFCITF